MSISQEKEKIRSEMRQKLMLQSLEDCRKKSLQVTQKLLKDDSYLNAKTIMFYVATPEELQTDSMIEHALGNGVQVLLPFVDSKLQMLKPARVRNLKDDLTKGLFGILEPSEVCRTEIDRHSIDLVLVPGLAFDQVQCRLGRGKGLYDRFLAKLPRSVTVFGLCFDFQLVPSLPVTENDIPLTRVIKNDR